jgi:hypothetical protein
MNDNGNLFENFIRNFYIKFGKLQILGYHSKSTLNRSVPVTNKRPPVLGGFAVDAS